MEPIKTPETTGNYQEFVYKRRLIWTERETFFFCL